jgi:hypothetical protein
MAVMGHMLHHHVGNPSGGAKLTEHRQHRLKTTGRGSDTGYMDHAGLTCF